MNTDPMAHKEPLPINQHCNFNNPLHLRPLRYHNGTNMAQPKHVLKIDAAPKPRKQASPAGKLYSSRGPKFNCKFALPEKYRARVERDLESYGVTMAAYFEFMAIDFLESGKPLIFHRQPEVSQK